MSQSEPSGGLDPRLYYSVYSLGQALDRTPRWVRK